MNRKVDILIQLRGRIFLQLRRRMDRSPKIFFLAIHADQLKGEILNMILKAYVSAKGRISLRGSSYLGRRYKVVQKTYLLHF